MSAFLLAALLFGVADVEVRFAPDQPVPLVYPDDPLIVEFQATEDLSATVQVQIQGIGLDPATIDLGGIDLRAGSPYWRALETATACGYYRAVVMFNAGDLVTERTCAFCRINRPRSPRCFPVGVTMPSPDRLSMLALKGIPLRSIQLNATIPDIEKYVREAFALEIQVGLVLPLEGTNDAEALAESLSKRFPDTVASWHLMPGAAVDLLDPVAQAIRRGGSRAPIVLVASNPQALVALLDVGAGASAAAIELQNDAPGELEVYLIREAAEHAGYESFPIYAVGRGVVAGTDEPGIRLARQVLLNAAAGIAKSHFDMPLIYDAGQLAEGYAYLSAQAQLLDSASYLGELDVPSPAHASVFRQGNRWTVALWTLGTSADLPLSVGSAQDLALADGRGNPLPAPNAPPEQPVSIHIDHEPVYLSGRGGDVIFRAALRMANNAAKTLAENEVFRQQLSKEILDVFDAVVTESTPTGASAPPKEGAPPAPPQKPARPSFFALLRAFPYIEQQWHSGELSRDTAVPLMAALTRLVRHLCTVEQESGEDFIEPLANTLGQCRELQTHYLMNSAGGTNSLERGEWLLNEVSRLTAEAEKLQAEERPIEARAVATLAEWRARSLEFAAQAVPERPGQLKVPQDGQPESEQNGGKLKLKKRVNQ